MDDINGLTPHACRVNGTVLVATIPWRFTHLCWNIPMLSDSLTGRASVIRCLSSAFVQQASCRFRS